MRVIYIVRQCHTKYALIQWIWIIDIGMRAYHKELSHITDKIYAPEMCG